MLHFVIAIKKDFLLIAMATENAIAPHECVFGRIAQFRRNEMSMANSMGVKVLIKLTFINPDWLLVTVQCAAVPR